MPAVLVERLGDTGVQDIFMAWQSRSLRFIIATIGCFYGMNAAEN